MASYLYRPTEDAPFARAQKHSYGMSLEKNNNWAFKKHK